MNSQIKDLLVEQIVNLVNDMLVVFPNDKLFLLCKNNFSLLDNNKDELIINIKYELTNDKNIEKYIKNRDENLFVISYSNYFHINKFTIIMNKLKSNWRKMDVNNKNKVWDYLNLFIMLLNKMN
jgi:hypothetical protein